MILRAPLFVIAAFVSVSACATAPEPCTAAWIDYRTEKVLKRFALENRGLVSDLRQLMREEGEIDPVQAILLAAKADDLRKFASGFETIIIPELESAVGQCGKDAGFIPAFTEFLRKEGVPEEALEWVGPMIALSQVIDSTP